MQNTKNSLGLLAAFFIFTCLLSFQWKNTMTTAQPKPKSYDDEYILERKKLNNAKFYPWFTEGYKAYQTNAEAIAVIEKHRKQLKFAVFGGSWCSDTHDFLPRFYKAVEEAKVPESNIYLVGVNLQKQQVGRQDKNFKTAAEYGITMVPTVIVFYNGAEAGRIVESAQPTVEEHLVQIITAAANR